jgi:hypothetical protein
MLPNAKLIEEAHAAAERIRRAHHSAAAPRQEPSNIAIVSWT